MIRVMETIRERLEEVDGGVFCPTDDCKEGAHDVVAVDVESRLLVGVCPLHGRFAIDVRREYEEELADRVEDERYQLGDQELGMQRDARTGG